MMYLDMKESFVCWKNNRKINISVETEYSFPSAPHSGLKTPALSFPCTGLFWRNKAVTSKLRTSCNEESAKLRLSQFPFPCLAKCILLIVSTSPCKALVFQIWDLWSHWTEEQTWLSVWSVSGATKVHLMSPFLCVNFCKKRSPSLLSSLTPCTLYGVPGLFFSDIKAVLRILIFCHYLPFWGQLHSLLILPFLKMNYTDILSPGEHLLPPVPAVWAKALLNLFQYQTEMNLEN